jgi:hypothetical protein
VAWLRVDDRSPMHPKVIHLRTLGDPVAFPSAVLGFVQQCAAWSGQHMTDCEIPLGVGEMVDAERWERLSKFAVKVGMLSRRQKLSDGQRGWLVCIDDGLFHLISREEREKNRHRRISRLDQNRVNLHLRDSDLCRYCGQTVNPSDTVGGRGREFEHPDPADPDVTVISCRRCNLFKAGRTPAEAGMQLRPPPNPQDRHFHSTTLKWLATRGIDPERPAAPIADPATAARHDSDAAAPWRAPAQPEDAAAERRALQALAAASMLPTSSGASEVPPEGVADQRPPGRVGSGQAGLGPVVHQRDGPRRRGSRGSRGRRHPHPK